MSGGATIRRLLIANRGEIAVRIARACRARGTTVIAVAPAADRQAMHTRVADLVATLPGGPLAYLDAGAVVAAIRETGADAVHPGYGFLSENAAFADAINDLPGVAWVGPPAAAIRAMGDKRRAKAAMAAAGVPTVPGADTADAEAAAAVGFPLLVKASAGGGGRGMRTVRAPGELADAVAAAAREAGAAFGDATVFLERLVEGARHVEVQVLADAHGDVVALGERDCSVQRRHQKVIEEAPSPAVDAALRARMGDAAVAAARAVGYAGAGTVEFLLAPTGEFFFLEMNTRLQVEHPVTELAFGVDLVEAQLRVAEGAPLSALALPDADAGPVGHAIEARLYAEDPAAGYLPQAGRIDRLVWPAGARLRIDAGVEAGDAVPVAYDPLLAKIIAHGPDRETARTALADALGSVVVEGVATNAVLLGAVLAHPTFAAGAATTDFLDATPALATDPPPPPPDPFAGAARGALGGWRSLGPAAVRLARGSAADDDAGGQPGDVVVAPRPGEAGVVDVTAGERTRTYALASPPAVGEVAVDAVTTQGAEAAAGVAGEVVAPMPGTVLAIRVAAGDRLAAGAVVAVMEAMKMETEVAAPAPGVVAEVLVAAGAAVAAGAPLVRLDPA